MPSASFQFATLPCPLVLPVWRTFGASAHSVAAATARVDAAVTRLTEQDREAGQRQADLLVVCEAGWAIVGVVVLVVTTIWALSTRGLSHAVLIPGLLIGAYTGGIALSEERMLRRRLSRVRSMAYGLNTNDLFPAPIRAVVGGLPLLTIAYLTYWASV